MQREKSKKDLAFEAERAKFRRTIRRLESENRDLSLRCLDLENEADIYKKLNSKHMDDIVLLGDFIGLDELSRGRLIKYLDLVGHFDDLGKATGYRSRDFNIFAGALSFGIDFSNCDPLLSRATFANPIIKLDPPKGKIEEFSNKYLNEFVVSKDMIGSGLSVLKEAEPKEDIDEQL